MCSALVCSASVCERMDVMIGNREVYRTELLAKKIPAASGVGSFSPEKISLLAKNHFRQETFPRRFRKRPFYCTVTVPYPATASCSMSSVGSTLQWGVHEVRLHEATTLYQSFSRAAVPCLPVTSHHPPTTHHPHRCASRTCHVPQPRPSSCCSTRASARAEALGQSQS